MYKVLYRYEHWSRDGKEWTKWLDTKNVFVSKKEAQDCITSQKKSVETVVKATKLKYEYKIEEVNE